RQPQPARTDHMPGAPRWPAALLLSHLPGRMAQRRYGATLFAMILSSASVSGIDVRNAVQASPGVGVPDQGPVGAIKDALGPDLPDARGQLLQDLLGPARDQRCVRQIEIQIPG